MPRRRSRDEEALAEKLTGRTRGLIDHLLEHDVAVSVQDPDAKVVHPFVDVGLAAVPDHHAVDCLLAAEVHFPPRIILNLSMGIRISPVLSLGVAIHGGSGQALITVVTGLACL